MTLFPFQEQFIKTILASRDSNRPIHVRSPVGSGKTFIGCELGKIFNEKDSVKGILQHISASYIHSELRKIFSTDPETYSYTRYGYPTHTKAKKLFSDHISELDLEKVSYDLSTNFPKKFKNFKEITVFLIPVRMYKHWVNVLSQNKMDYFDMNSFTDSEKKEMGIKTLLDMSITQNKKYVLFPYSRTSKLVNDFLKLEYIYSNIVIDEQEFFSYYSAAIRDRFDHVNSLSTNLYILSADSHLLNAAFINQIQVQLDEKDICYDLRKPVEYDINYKNESVSSVVATCSDDVYKIWKKINAKKKKIEELNSVLKGNEDYKTLAKIQKHTNDLTELQTQLKPENTQCSICLSDKQLDFYTYCCSDSLQKKKVCKDCYNRFRDLRCPICSNDFSCSTLKDNDQYMKNLEDKENEEKKEVQKFIETSKDPENISDMLNYIQSNIKNDEDTITMILCFLQSRSKITNIEERILVFSAKHFYFTNANKLYYGIKELVGNKNTINKRISDHQDSNDSDRSTKILLLNSETMSSGLNLQKSTTIIIVDSVEEDVKKQIIGRAYRIDRDKNLPLNIINLKPSKGKQVEKKQVTTSKYF